MKLLKTKSIKIDGKDYPLVRDLSALMEYEELAGHGLHERDKLFKTIRDKTYMFYACIKAGGTDITYNDFINLIKNNPELIGDFVEILVELSGGNEEPEKKSKTR